MGTKTPLAKITATYEYVQSRGQWKVLTVQDDRGTRYALPGERYFDQVTLSRQPLCSGLARASRGTSARTSVRRSLLMSLPSYLQGVHLTTWREPGYFQGCADAQR